MFDGVAVVGVAVVAGLARVDRAVAAEGSVFGDDADAAWRAHRAFWTGGGIVGFTGGAVRKEATRGNDAQHEATDEKHTHGMTPSHARKRCASPAGAGA